MDQNKMIQWVVQQLVETKLEIFDYQIVTHCVCHYFCLLKYTFRTVIWNIVSEFTQVKSLLFDNHSEHFFCSVNCYFIELDEFG